MTTTQPTKGDKANGADDMDKADEKIGKARKSASAFRTISEVADDLGVQQHVLRFWETKFTQVKPLKRGGGRRYYRPEDVILLKKIHHLLYTEGYTIKGVQKLIKGQGKQQIVAGDIISEAADNALAAAQEISKSAGADAPPAVTGVTATVTARREGTKLSDRQRVILESMLGELKDLRSMIRDK